MRRLSLAKRGAAMQTAVRILAVVGAIAVVSAAVVPVLLRAADGHDETIRGGSVQPAVPLSQAFVPPSLSDAQGTAAASEGPNPFAGGSRPRLPPRQACLDRIDRHAGMAGTLKSRLQLTDDQLAAWLRVESAAEPALRAMREVCAQLPELAGDPPPLPDTIDLEEKGLTARAAFLRAIREPLRDLYARLTPQQRAMLQRPQMGSHMGPHGGAL